MKRSSHRIGWTLIELLAVVALLSLLMAGSVFTFRAPLAVGRLKGDVDRVLLADRTVRSEARRFHRTAHLMFQWKHGSKATLERNRQQKPSAEMPLVVESLTEVRTAGLTNRSNNLVIPFDAAGRSPTYALKFLTPHAKETWVVVAGGTGQPILDLTPKQVHELFALLRPPSTP